MKPYGTMREHPMDNKRRYLNGRMSHEDRREERRDKRAARAEGKAAIVAALAACIPEEPGDGVMRCAPDCPVCDPSVMP